MFFLACGGTYEYNGIAHDYIVLYGNGILWV
jgi:hypothetical protein